MSKSTTTVSKSSQPESETAIYPTHQSLGISIHSLITGTPHAIHTWLMSLPQAFHASRSVSQANAKRKQDERNLWPATIRTIRTIRPRYALLENVHGLLSSGYFGTILGDLAESGYDTRWRILSAAELGAPHRRDRLWIVAHTTQQPQREPPNQTNAIPTSRQARNESSHSGQPMADTGQGRRRPRTTHQPHQQQPFAQPSHSGQPMADTHGKSMVRSEIKSPVRNPWPTEPNVGRVAHGVARRMDRLRAIGNGQVPRVVAAAWEFLTQDLITE